jgi:zinc transporter 1/2/3
MCSRRFTGCLRKSSNKTSTVDKAVKNDENRTGSTEQTELRNKLEVDSLNNTIEQNVTDISEPNGSHHHVHEFHQHAHHQHDHKNLFIVVVSLSAHSLFDGLLLGLKNNEKDMWSFLLVILLHHTIMSFSVGCISYASDRNNTGKLRFKKLIILSTLWSFIIPVGIFIAVFQASIDKLITGVLSNIATGSFLYITFMELLPSSFQKKLPYKMNLVLMLAGYGVICLTEIGSDAHGH